MNESEMRAWMAEIAPQYLQPAVVAEFVRRVDDEIEAQSSVVAADPALRREIDASTHAQLRLMIGAVASGSTDITPPPESIALALTVARRGLDLGVLLKFYGVGRMAALRFVNEAIEDLDVEPDVKRALLVHVWGLAMNWLETMTERLVAAYAGEREELTRGALARRVETVRALIDGTSINVDEAARILDHPLRRHHTAFVVWTTQADPPSDILGTLTACARNIAGAVGETRVLSMPSGARELWAWIAHSEDPATSGWTEEQLSEHLPAGHGLHVAIGTSGHGVAGFARSHREALAARRIASCAPTPAPVTLYDSVQVACLMTDDRDTLRALVRRELRGLAAPGAVPARLRETLRTYYADNCRPGVTAERLGLHKNTVRYRLDQAAELLGHGLDERRLPVELALVGIDTYGVELLDQESIT